jgi:hypothetical protein
MMALPDRNTEGVKFIFTILPNDNGCCTGPQTNTHKKDHILLQVVQMEWVKLRVRLEKEMGVKVASLEV